MRKMADINQDIKEITEQILKGELNYEELQKVQHDSSVLSIEWLESLDMRLTNIEKALIITHH